jgi:hypothetical protein
VGRRRSAVKRCPHRCGDIIVLGRLFVVGLALLSPSPRIAAAGSDAEWPCQQRLVPMLTAGMIWNGPPIDDVGDWRADPRVRELVERVIPREVGAERGEVALKAFVEQLDSDKARPIMLAFSGLLEETNHERAEVIGRIKDLGERQRNLAALIDRLTTELGAMTDAEHGDASPARTELQQRLTYTSRTYAEVQRTMRYACQVPASLDARLGAYARVLESALH